MAGMPTGRELRRQILRYLLEQEHSDKTPEVKEIAEALDLSARNVSDQIDILEDSGAVMVLRAISGDAWPGLTGYGKQLLEQLEEEAALSGSQPSKQEKRPGKMPSAAQYDWDVFIAHASEDKPFVGRLAKELSKEVKVWYDDFVLTVGDSLRRSIDNGLARSRYGIVVLSPRFFVKKWPQRELDGLASFERDGQKVILPVWLKVEADSVRRYSPTLSDLKAAKAKDGVEQVAAQVLRVIKPKA